METEPQSDTPETDAMEYFDSMCDPDRVVEAGFARKLERERNEAVRSCYIWQKGHSDIVADRDLWKAEAKRWKTISQTQTTQHYANPN